MGMIIQNGKIFATGEEYHKYSTTERVVGEWIDGSAVYEKTIDIAQYSVEAVDSEFRNVVAIADADFLISAECSKQAPNTTQQLRFYISNGYLQVAAKTTITLTALVSYYVTIRYTKSSS